MIQNIPHHLAKMVEAVLWHGSVWLPIATEVAGDFYNVWIYTLSHSAKCYKTVMAALHSGDRQ